MWVKITMMIWGSGFAVCMVRVVTRWCDLAAAEDALWQTFFRHMPALYI
jgi:hypothetical protein